MELYLTANAATFVLGVLANSDNLAYAPNAKHWVPDVIGVLHPAEHPAMAQAERVWHLKVLERLSNLTEAPTSEWFAANWEA